MLIAPPFNGGNIRFSVFIRFIRQPFSQGIDKNGFKPADFPQHIIQCGDGFPGQCSIPESGIMQQLAIDYKWCTFRIGGIRKSVVCYKDSIQTNGKV